MRRSLIILATGDSSSAPGDAPPSTLPLLGRPVVGYVLDAARQLEAEEVLVVVDSHHARPVAEYLDSTASSARVVEVGQGQPMADGDAVHQALRHVPDAEGTVFVVAGDLPLLRPECLLSLAAAHGTSHAAATLLTADGALRTPRYDSPLRAFDAQLLRTALHKLGPDSGPRRTTLADVLRLFRDERLRIDGHGTDRPADVLRCPGPAELTRARLLLRGRINEAWLHSGVTIIEPDSAWIDATVRLEPGVTLEPGVILRGRTSIAAGSVIGPDATLIDTTVEAGASVIRAHAVSATVGAGASVGPFAYLRPDTVLGERTKIGTFVEVKQATVGDGTQVAHLAYVGNASLGTDVNIGAGTTFSLYDGVTKHHTTVGDAAFIGCHTSLVAPVNVGPGAFTAAGSVITKDVPAGALAVERGPQNNVEGWVARRRAGTPWAAAAETATVGRKADDDGSGS
ncbi:bifunctional N-acetylglucosamine-1-phosphate uridyltransferase/glucosamine-1-phosphate acetyltransferase [Streptomyces sp. NPDC059788]|uniref:bifunctional UDP-N-acetylglucosamine diphosphorylase/glucosamine-1-phosphate N-acetyltransferase GlmU n=1 Tax=Streptomyces sp. NPDC059788 TaxID=3346948 RepID=UPI00364CF7AB